MKNNVRVRFAPSPTGIMHLGNIRTALLNYLFAKKKKGTFVLRIEDTDPERNFDPHAQKIIEDLQWLNLDYDEGPIKGGPYAPYFQSERSAIYQKKLDELEKKDFIYRCFCTPQELEKKRQRTIALKLPPRYDRTCLNLTQEEIQKRLSEGRPFIWRFKIPQDKKITITDMARGAITFDLKNFSDFPLTRTDGSFTFLFANAIDDMLMNITHVLRGEDHLSNTANQAVLYEAFGETLPIFWHLPILCNPEGKKLSKRDFGFSLHDLKESGYLPEAIENYLAIIGGSFEQEIMSLDELVQAMNFDRINPTGNIKYDVEKLKWVNHKWINQYDPEKLADHVLPFLNKAYPQVNKLDKKTITQLVQVIKSELTTLLDAIPALHFYFMEPTITQEMIREHIPHDLQDQIEKIVHNTIAYVDKPEQFYTQVKEEAKKYKVPTKLIFSILRLALTEVVHGPSIKELLAILGPERSRERLSKIIK